MVFLLKWQAIIAIVSSHCTQERLAYLHVSNSCTGLPKAHFWRSWSWTVLWRPTRPSRTNTQKGCPLHYKGLECKSRKSRAIWSNRQIWPWSTKQSRAQVNRVFPREYTGHSKHPLPTTQEKTLHMWHHQMVNTKIRLIIFFAAKDGEALYSQQKQDQGLIVAQIMNSLLTNSNLNWRT